MSERIKSKIRVQTMIRVIPSALFLVFLFYMMAKTYTGTVKNTVEDTDISVSGFVSLSDSFEEVLQSNFYEKNLFIDINGLSAGTLGINSLNERVKLPNGHLTNLAKVVDTSKNANRVISLDELLNERGIGFVYLLAPGKSAFYGLECAPGYSSDAWKNIDSMISALDEAGVQTIDMDAWFEENGWDMDDVYFKTDHHWRPEAALAAARCAMELFSAQGLAEYHEDWLEDENWTVTVYEDLFLGSHGKRTGALYAGADDLSVYQPDFATNYAYSALTRDTTTWTYRDTILDLSYTQRRDYYNDNPYVTYMYADYPLRIIQNSDGWNDKRILIIGDSYKSTVEYFLTTQFQEVYTIDLRYYTDGTLAEFVEEIQPDIVLMCSCSNTIGGDEIYDFGVGRYLAAQNAEIGEDEACTVTLEDAGIEAQADNSNHFMVLYADLEPGQAYTLTLDSAFYTGGSDRYIQMTLQNLSSNKAVCNRYFDANSEEEQRWCFTTPENTGGVYAIYLYAGTKGHTENASVEVTDIVLEKGY